MVSKWWHARSIGCIWDVWCALHEGQAETSAPRFLKYCSLRLCRASICRGNKRRRIHHRPGYRRCRNSSGCLRPYDWRRRMDGENTSTLVCACVRACACVIECLWLRACVCVFGCMCVRVWFGNEFGRCRGNAWTMCEFHDSSCNGFGDIWWTYTTVVVFRLSSMHTYR